ncbi:MAG: autotransporter domain-containing protein [Thermodesulfobacteriota bacterium]
MESKNDCWWCLLGAALGLTAVLAAASSRAADLHVDGGATYTVTGNVSFNNAYIGDLSTGTLNQGNFTNSLTGSLFLGYNPGSTGIYNLSGGSLAVAGGEIVGNYGSGVFNQSGGANACGNLTLGYRAGSHGTYNQSDGTNTVSGILFLGYHSGGGGVYTLNGGSLSAGFEYIGSHGFGLFTQNGGANTISNNLLLGESSGSSGTYNLNSGSLQAPNQLVGSHGNGIFNQNGGSNTINKGPGLIGLVLGFWNDGNGTYNLNNGSLSAWSETIGRLGAGTFNQSNGTNQVSEDLIVGLGNGLTGSGTYNLGGGKLSADNVCVGYAGTGAFNQSGGSNTVAHDLVLGCNTTGVGVYNLSGGTLSVLNEVIGYSGQGSFLQTGGVHSIAGNLTLGANSGGRGSLSLLGGSLAVGGNYAQNANSSLALGIVSPSNYQRINIGGTASLGGTLTPVLLGDRPRGNQVYTVLTAAGGLSGTFTLTNPWINPTLYWQQRYNADSLDLRVNRDYDHPGLGLNSNQAAVGFMLNNLAETASGDLDTVLNAIDNLPTSGGVQDAFKQISPDKAAALTTLGFAGATFQMRNLATRITNLRFRGDNFGQRGGLGSLDLNASRESGVMLAYNGTRLPGLLRVKKKPPAPESRWGFFGDGGAAFGAQENTVNQTGFDFTLAGFTAGGDYRVTDHLLLGLATGYSHAAAGFRGSGGALNANTWPLNAYAAYLPGSFYAYGSLGYALNLFDLERGLNFGGLSRTAKSSTTGHQFNAYGETGYDLKVWRYILTPAATLAYSHIWVDAFTEDDAGALNLQVGPQNADSLQTGVGGRLTLPLKVARVNLAPQAYAFYQHEFANGSRGLNAGLSQAGSTFSFRTDAPQRDFAVLGAAVAAELTPNLWARVNYSAEVGRSTYTAHYLQAGLRYEF